MGPRNRQTSKMTTATHRYPKTMNKPETHHPHISKARVIVWFGVFGEINKYL